MLVPPLKYHSIKIGKANLQKNNNHLSLSYDNRSWMGLNINNNWQADEFIIEYKLARGICVTTGLGLGIIQTLLCQNEKVEKVVVYEKNQEIIDIFLTIVNENNFDISKLEIKQKNADELVDENCDCMFVDHFEGEPEQEILARVKNIETNNKTSVLWYWPAAHHFIMFCESRRKVISQESYTDWKSYTKLDYLPNTLDSEILDDFYKIREVYISNASGYLQKIVKDFDNRNKLLEKFGNKRINK